jgi:hypothetical protein
MRGLVPSPMPRMPWQATHCPVTMAAWARWPDGNATGFTPFEFGAGATDGSGALHSAISPPQLGSFEEVAATIQRDPAACSQLKPSMLESFGNVDYPGLY